MAETMLEEEKNENDEMTVKTVSNENGKTWIFFNGMEKTSE